MKILILGKGVSGGAAKHLADVIGWEAEMVSDGEVTDYSIIFDGVGSVVLSPGVRETSGILQEAYRRGLEIIGEMEFGFRYFSGKIFAITGTNGKTTCTEMLNCFFSALDMPGVAAGNIGTPLSEIAALQQEGVLSKNLYAALEVSSFQLEYIRDFAPTAAACLNIQSDHLDRYNNSMEQYAKIKRKIFRHLPVKDHICGQSMHSFEGKFGFDGTFVTFDKNPWFKYSETALLGMHNLENLLAALELLSYVATNQEIKSDKLLSAIKSFHTGKHRLEVVLESNGVRFVDDSKATNPASVVAAAHALGSKKLHIILGGLDKGMDFSGLRELAPYLKAVYLIGESASKIRQAIPRSVACYDFNKDFADCVRAASQAAQPGDIVLLSPACASMDMFKDYVDRGNQFAVLSKRYAKSL